MSIVSCGTCNHDGAHAQILPRDAVLTRCPDCDKCQAELLKEQRSK